MDKNMNSVFDGKQFVHEKRMSRIMLFSKLIIYPIVIMAFFSIFIVLMLVIALLGQTFSLIFFSFKINYLKACPLLIVSATPMFLMLFTYFTFNLFFRGLGYVLITLLMGYYAFAVFSLKSDSLKIVSS